MALFLILNLSIAIFYTVLISGNTATDIIVGFILGVLILSFVELDYGRFLSACSRLRGDRALASLDQCAHRGILRAAAGHRLPPGRGGRPA
ncbi:MAG: hypothetical protein R2851_27465 [Caldilineaceae bacterium]